MLYSITERQIFRLGRTDRVARSAMPKKRRWIYTQHNKEWVRLTVQCMQSC